jgi:hypothetical protein
MRFLAALLITLLTLFYLFPTAVAVYRKRANTGAIFALNLFLGWSLLIGWVLALVWAFKARRNPLNALDLGVFWLDCLSVKFYNIAYSFRLISDQETHVRRISIPCS